MSLTATPARFTQALAFTRADIAARIPHGAPLCMLDGVERCTEDAIVCISRQLPHAEHPLDATSELTGLILIEYAAQAAALHAALVANSEGLSASGAAAARPAYIGAVKDVELHAAISDNQAPLQIHANCELASAAGAIYAVKIICRAVPIMSGRLILSQASAAQGELASFGKS